MKNNDLWTVEYSISQGYFHFDKLEKTISRNQHETAHNNPHDWHVINVCDSLEECVEFSQAWYDAGNCPEVNTGLLVCHF